MQELGKQRPHTGGQPVRALVALVLVLASLLAAWLTHRAVDTHQRTRFDAEAERIDVALEQRMTAYVQVLRGGIGLFRASNEVTRTDWRRYVDTLALDERYPGFKSLSFARAVPDAELSAFLARVRAEPAPAGLVVLRTMRDYRLQVPADAAGVTPIHSPIEWVAPFTAENQVVLGVDMMREPRRRTAMLEAGRTSQAVLSPRLQLSGSANAEAGFIAYVAVRRRGELDGWLTAAFRAEQFMRGLLGPTRSPLAFEVRDGGGALLHSTAGVRPDGAPRPLGDPDVAYERRARVAMPGRTWEVRYVAETGFVPVGSRLAPWLVLLAGLLTSAAFVVVGRIAERWRRLAGRLAAQAEDLRRARADAEAATDAKAAFLATMSHEIRTPMNAVVGMSALLADGLTDEHQRGQAEVIRSSGDHLLRVIDDILEVSKLEAGKVVLEELAFSPRDCATGVVALLRADAERADVTLAVEVAPGVPDHVTGDPGRLRQVLLNLVANAVRFTPAGGRVTLTIDPADTAGGPRLRFAVRDTGPGIDAAVHERLFAAFEQADPSTTRTHGGTGLGLTISQELVGLMGGRIAIDSAPGRGATFRFAIPLPAAAPPPPLAAQHPAPGAVASLRVLVAEDSAVNQTVARTLLERLGHEVEIVGDGAAALEAVERHPFDVVLLDLRMPVLDGLAVARAIRARIDREAGPWLVAMTADVLPEHREQARAAGMHDFLAKPVTLPALDATLRRVPARARVRGS
ncbi:response regulator [Conexibacter sp. W3-3-2]|uniref:CHASE domain-containing protein n=1 Tax=Conexibacter sp. W3-3-2 TaxID=2675227 RepID=UPI0012BA13A5|nr:CHASE domain-containing protein [Conexibacter sp. W3-3-2]MTD45165.1 response regulator [Conexibacter sp. W3-3-2]